MRAVRGLVSFISPPRRLFFRSRGGEGGVTSDRKDGPIGEMSDDESSAKLSKCDAVGAFEDEVDNECCICLVDMEERKFRGKMDCCDHVVCWFCIQEWSQKTSRTCPICQRAFRKCTKTKAKRKKGRRNPPHDPNSGKKRKERTLWANVRRRFPSARQSSSSVPQSWAETEENEEVGAGEEEIVVLPMRDSRDVEQGNDNSNSNGNGSSNEEHSHSDESSGGGNPEGHEQDDEAEGGRDGGVERVDEEEEAEEVAEAAEVGGNSAEQASPSREGEESDAFERVLLEVDDEVEANDATSTVSDERGEDQAEVEESEAVEKEQEQEEKEEPAQVSAATETNFIVGDDDPKGKGKEQDSAEEEAEEEWERKGNESDDEDEQGNEHDEEQEEEQEEEEDSDFDNNGPIRLPEDNNN